MNDEELKTYDGPGKVITSYDKMDEIHSKRQVQRTVHYNFGIVRLDEMCNGARGGELILVSGDEGEGKTTLARTFINNFASQSCQSLLFSCEERPDRLLGKFGEQVPWFLWPSEIESTSLNWMWERYKEAKVKYATKEGPVGCIVIDHLMYLEDGKETGNEKEDLWRYCRKLKKWALAENVVIILIHHTNRTEGKEEPSNRSSYGSGGPTKEADTVMFVWRMDNGTNEAVIKVTKCRETGAKGKVLVEKTGPYLVQREEIHQMHSIKLDKRRSGDE